MSHQQDTLDAGFTVVVDTDGVAHRTGGPCFKDSKWYIPFSGPDEAEAHGNHRCSRCLARTGAVDAEGRDEA